MDAALCQQIRAALQAKLGNRLVGCSLCGGVKWAIEPGIVNVRVDSEIMSSMVVGGPVYPVVLLTCDACGETKMVNLIKLLGKERLEEMERLKRGDDLARKALES